MDPFIILINQLIEIKQKIEKENFSDKLERNFNRMFTVFEEEGYKIVDPIGEKYTETRVDCEATIIGRESKDMKIIQVIKPIIYKQKSEGLALVQKGIVMVEKI